VSCRSAAAVYRHLSPTRYAVLPIGIDRNGDFFLYKGDCLTLGDEDFRKKSELLCPTFPVRLSSHSGFLAEGAIRPVDVALPILHGRGGEDGEVQGLLSAAAIPFVGCDAAASALCFDKEYAKLVALSVGIDTARFVSIPAETETAELSTPKIIILYPPSRLFCAHFLKFFQYLQKSNHREVPNRYFHSTQWRKRRRAQDIQKNLLKLVLDLSQRSASFYIHLQK
jgi:D-alanine---D-serine ligase